MQIQTGTSIRSNYTPTRIARMKRPTIPSVDKDGGRATHALLLRLYGGAIGYSGKPWGGFF